MRLTDWLKKLWLLEHKEISYMKLRTVEEQTKILIGYQKYQEVTNLLKKYRNSNEIVECIGMQIYSLYITYTPKQAVQEDIIKMMKSLKNTSYMAKRMKQLTSVPPAKANDIDFMLAVHTFMLNKYLQRYSGSDILQPKPTEVHFAEQILDSMRKDKDIPELCNLAIYNMLPAVYIRERYGLVDDCNRVLTQYFDLDNIMVRREDCTKKWEGRLERKAEHTLESISDLKMPKEYIKKLDEELQKLVQFAKSPELVKDCDEKLLFKYNIQKDSPITQQQIEAACRLLDARLVRMTGRKPYAEEISAFLKPISPSPRNDSLKKLFQKKSEQKLKGRKL